MHDDSMRSCAAAPRRARSRRTLLKGIAGAALASGGALAATSHVDGASRCADRQRQICKDYFAKGDPLTLCQQRGLTQGQCINECTAERTALKCT